MKSSFYLILIISVCFAACDVTVESQTDADTLSASSVSSNPLTSPDGAPAGAGVNISGCNNEDGLTDIIGPDAVPPFSEADLIFDIPIVSSNCVIGAGPTEHYSVLARLPDSITPPDRPVVWNFENTGLPCFASTETFNFTTHWAQRITPSGNVILECNFKAEK